MALIDMLKGKGYRINLETYYDSLTKCFDKVESLVTKVISKKKELEQQGEAVEGASFDGLMANLVVNGMQVNDDLKLARYNEIVSILKKRNEPKRHGRNKP